MAGARIISRRRNPIHHGQELPYDEWVPSHAVKFNSDGTVDVMTEAQHNRRRNIQGGFWECHGTPGDCDPDEREEMGTFHPIRSSSDYDRSLVGEGGARRRKKPAKRRPAAKKKRRR